MNIQKRSNNRAVQVRTDDDGKKTIVGYAAVWYREGDAGTEYPLWSDCIERIEKTAFDRVLKDGPDCRALFNHDVNMVLGRTISGTCRLNVDSVGLRYEIDAPDTQVARDILALLNRGDVTGSSFSFTIKTERFEKREGQPDLRIIEEVEQLYDVGPVTYPAYAATSAAARSPESFYGDEDRWEYEEFLKRLDEQEKRFTEMQERQELLEMMITVE